MSESIRRLRPTFRRWPNDHPFLLALIVLLAVVIPGFLRLEYIADTSKDAAVKAKIAADSVQDQADRNTAIVSCLTSYAANLTDALQDRDTVSKTARAAQREKWMEIHDWLSTQPPGADRGPMLEAILRYLTVLERLERAEAINPYPDIAACLPAMVANSVFRLVAADRHLECLGRKVTIYGTSRNNVIHGTDKRDVVRAFDGDDLIFTGDGRDLICAGKGDDTINGGRGFDSTRGQMGSDVCIQIEIKRSCR